MASASSAMPASTPQALWEVFMMNDWHPLDHRSISVLEKQWHDPSSDTVDVKITLLGGKAQTYKASLEAMQINGQGYLRRNEIDTVTSKPVEYRVEFWDDDAWMPYNDHCANSIVSALKARRRTTVIYISPAAYAYKIKLDDPKTLLQQNAVTGRFRPLRVMSDYDTSKSVSNIDWTGVSDESLAALPDVFLCPIRQMPFEMPVIADDGITYEQEAMQKWLAKKWTSPATGKPLNSGRLVVNLALRDIIATWIKEIKASETMEAEEEEEEDEVPPAKKHKTAGEDDL